MAVTQVEVLEAKELLKNEAVIFVDIRDDVSYALGHPERAIHLTSASLHYFISNTDKETPILITCYHGISSLSVGEYLISEGFEEVYSLAGGYEAWKRGNDAR